MSRTTVTIFAFHHAGGSSSAFIKWKQCVPEDVELVFVELPGRGARHGEPAMENFHELIETLRPVFEAEPKGPTILFGHSMGALIAFELFRSLSPAARPKVQALALSSFCPPTGENMLARGKISDLPDDEFVERIEEFAALPPEVLADPSTRGFFVNLIRKDTKLIESYASTDSSRVEVPLLVLGGRDDAGLPLATLQGWEKFGRLAFPPQLLPGGHFYISTEYPSVIKLVLKLLDANLK